MLHNTLNRRGHSSSSHISHLPQELRLDGRLSLPHSCALFCSGIYQWPSSGSVNPLFESVIDNGGTPSSKSSFSWSRICFACSIDRLIFSWQAIVLIISACFWFVKAWSFFQAVIEWSVFKERVIAQCNYFILSRQPGFSFLHFCLTSQSGVTLSPHSHYHHNRDPNPTKKEACHHKFYGCFHFIPPLPRVGSTPKSFSYLLFLGNDLIGKVGVPVLDNICVCK